MCKIITQKRRIQVPQRNANHHQSHKHCRHKNPDITERHAPKATHAPRHINAQRFRRVPCNQDAHNRIDKVTRQKPDNQKHARLRKTRRRKHHDKRHKQSPKRRRAQHADTSKANTRHKRKRHTETRTTANAKHKRSRKRIPEHGL